MCSMHYRRWKRNGSPHILLGPSRNRGSLIGTYKHGMAKTRFWNVWRGMKDRCLNPNSVAYKNYGGRGVRVCERWLTFDGFQQDMFPTYTKTSTIERIDVDGNYEPSNCKWITISENQRNKRNTIQIDYKGRKRRLVEVAESLGLPYNTLYNRLFTYKLPHKIAFQNHSLRGLKRSS